MKPRQNFFNDVSDTLMSSLQRQIDPSLPLPLHFAFVRDIVFRLERAHNVNPYEGKRIICSGVDGIRVIPIVCQIFLDSFNRCKKHER